jgi:hypothetical protein
MSPIGYDAMGLQQKASMLGGMQKVFRNDLLSDRSMDSSTIDPSSCASSTTNSIQQGMDYHQSCPKNVDGSCPPGPDMSQYIKKDAIPCWGCSVDY